MSTSPLWTSLARAALSTLPHFLVDICMSGVAKQEGDCELMYIVVPGRKELSSCLAHASLVSICLACVQALIALDICVSDAIQKKGWRSTPGAVHLLEHSGSSTPRHGGIT
jgi:hypothetical protein